MVLLASRYRRSSIVSVKFWQSMYLRSLRYSALNGLRSGVLFTSFGLVRSRLDWVTLGVL